VTALNYSVLITRIDIQKCPRTPNIPDPEGATILLELVNSLGNKSNVDLLRKWAA